MSRHKHADLIHAWAEGAEIEYKSNRHNKWADPGELPIFSSNFEFRVKPKEKVFLRDVSVNEQIANANLIAAAPELLEVLEQVIDEWQYGYSTEDASEVYAKARQVIAKAKGEA